MTAFLGPFLCDAAADCPKALVRQDANGGLIDFTLTTCGTDRNYPSGAKTCHYRVDR